MEKVSVIMTVKNEGLSIEGLLQSLFNQTKSPDEVVVVDGGSSDGTADKIGLFMGKGIPLTLIRTRDASRGEGRNAAIRAAKYHVIAMTDGGCRMDKKW